MAAPHVTGLIALLLAEHPGIKPTMVRSILERTASGAGTWSRELGYGEIDAQAAYNDPAAENTDLYGSLAVAVTQGVTRVIGAEVLIRTSGGQTVAANRTYDAEGAERDGIAYFQYLRAGDYTINVTKETRKSETIPIKIQAGQTEKVEVSLP